MNAGILLFRCLLMYLVVVHHVIVHTSFATDARLFPLFLLTIPAVDGFVSISGWFGVRFGWRKCGVIAGQIVYYAVLSSLFSFFAVRMGWMERPVVAVGNAWYGVAYLALLLVSPLLNAGLEAVAANGTWRRVLELLAVLAVADFVSRGVGLGFTVSGFGSHTFATFFLVYCGMWLLRRRVCGRYRRLVVTAGIAMFALSCIGFVGVRLFGGETHCLKVVERFGLYNSPFVMSAAFSAVTVFAGFKVPAKFMAVLTGIAPSLFAVYLLSDASPVGRMFLIERPVAGMTAVDAVAWSAVVFGAGIAFDLLVRRIPLLVLRRIYGKVCHA